MLQVVFTWRKVVAFAICLTVTMISSCGDGGKKQDKTATSDKDVVQPAGKKGKLPDKSLVENIRNTDQKLISVKNAYANVYSSVLSGTPTVFVIFNSNNTKANMQAFIKIIDESAEELVKKYKDYTYYAFDENNNMVLAYSGLPTDLFFSVEGYYFYVDGKPSEMDVNCPYRSAFQAIVKESRGVQSLTEWDYFMFRTRMPVDEEENSATTNGLILLGTSALAEVVKTDWELIFRMGQFDAFVQIFENRENMQDYIANMQFGIILFNPEGKRVMTETITGSINNRKRERKWHNGYRMPE